MARNITLFKQQFSFLSKIFSSNLNNGIISTVCLDCIGNFSLPRRDRGEIWEDSIDLSYISEIFEGLLVTKSFCPRSDSPISKNCSLKKLFRVN
jgi:hypothetical protein